MRYIPHTDEDRKEMLSTIGVKSIEDLFEDIPKDLRQRNELHIPEALDEHSILKTLNTISEQNQSLNKLINFLGAGVYEHYIPSTVLPLITRGEFLTAYTPYQPELSQGYLQTIYEFQSLVCEITKMDVANASMYDGATASAEAVIMSSQIKNKTKAIVEKSIHPHYLECIKTFANAAGCEIIECEYDEIKNLLDDSIACVVLQYPDFYGRIKDISLFRKQTQEKDAHLIVISEPIALGVIKPPGEYGADCVVGEMQPCGIPMGYGGPMAGYFTVKKEMMRSIPGRIVGRTKDAEGRRGFTMTLRTREQDIRREKATSNICTNQALMALASTVWLCALGKNGFRQLAEACVKKAHYTAKLLTKIPNVKLQFPNDPFVFEFTLNINANANKIQEKLLDAGILAGLPLGNYNAALEDCLLLCVTEVRTKEEIDKLALELAKVVN